MKSNIENFQMISAKNLKDALKTINNKDKNWKLFAGGTDLMVLLELGKLGEGNYLNIFGIEELSKISVTKETIEIGASVTFREIAENKSIQRELPLLAQAASQIGAIAIQNRATIGGNIANASPAADSPPALIAYGACLEISSYQQKRVIPLEEFYQGYKKINLNADEIITKIIIPRDHKRLKGIFQKIGPRKAMAISKVIVCSNAKITNGIIDDIRIVVGSVAATTLRLNKIENYLLGKKIEPEVIATALALLENEITPISDIRSTDRYRRKVVENILTSFLSSIAE